MSNKAFAIRITSYNVCYTKLLRSYKIPYGTIETKADGILDSITEKPEITFYINTGLYILEPHLINEIPKDTFYHITSLIEKLQVENRRVGVFPVSENSWTRITSYNVCYTKLLRDRLSSQRYQTSRP